MIMGVDGNPQWIPVEQHAAPALAHFKETASELELTDIPYSRPALDSSTKIHLIVTI